MVCCVFRQRHTTRLETDATAVVGKVAGSGVVRGARMTRKKRRARVYRGGDEAEREGLYGRCRKGVCLPMVGEGNPAVIKTQHHRSTEHPNPDTIEWLGKQQQRIVNLRFRLTADCALSLEHHKKSRVAKAQPSPRTNTTAGLAAGATRAPPPPSAHVCTSSQALPAESAHGCHSLNGIRSKVTTDHHHQQVNVRGPNTKSPLLAPLPLDKQKGVGEDNTNTTCPSTAPTHNTGVTKQRTRQLASSSCIGRSRSKGAPAAGA
ncbi:unnamed protein product, partial [Ectocarpus sp. 12 AP-2014]